MKCTRCGQEATQIEQRDNNWWCLRCKLYVIPPPDGLEVEPATQHEFVEDDIAALRRFLDLWQIKSARGNAVFGVLACVIMIVAFATVGLSQILSLRSAKSLVEGATVESDLAPNLRAAVSEIEEAAGTVEEVVGIAVALLLFAGVTSILAARRLGKQRRVAQILAGERGAAFLELGRRR